MSNKNEVTLFGYIAYITAPWPVSQVKELVQRTNTDPQPLVPCKILDKDIVLVTVIGSLAIRADRLLIASLIVTKEKKMHRVHRG